MKTSTFILAIALLSIPAAALADTSTSAKKIVQPLKKKSTIVKKPENEKSIDNQLKTAAQRIRLRQAGLGILTPTRPEGGGKDRIPNTRLDSFVLKSGGLGNAIYGDEGSSQPPPYFGFGTRHRVNSISENYLNQAGMPLYPGGIRFDGEPSLPIPAWRIYEPPHIQRSENPDRLPNLDDSAQSAPVDLDIISP